jgi:NAD(P) transhydrogenase subunit alpha
MPSDASAFFAKNIANLLDIMVTSQEGKLVLNDFETDEITQSALVRPEA